MFHKTILKNTTTREKGTTCTMNYGAKTYTSQEVADMLGIGKSTLLRAVKNSTAPHLRPIRIGGTVRFPRATIDKLVAADDQ